MVAAFGLTSCNSGDDSETPTSSSAPTDDASTAEAQRLDKANAQVTAHIVQIGRGVKKKQQTAIRRQIAKPIKAWSDAAYLAGDFPHAGYTQAGLPRLDRPGRRAGGARQGRDDQRLHPQEGATR